MLSALIVSFYVMYFVTVVAMEKDHILAQEFHADSPSSKFSQHRILVHPIVYHARSKREIDSTQHSKGLHHPKLMIKINIGMEEYVLDLRLNEDLISEDHVISYQEDGKTVLYKSSIEELDICQYSGVVRNQPNSWAAVSTCHGVRGVIYDGRRLMHIEPAEKGEISSAHYIYDRFDLNITHKCGFNGGADFIKDDDNLNNTRPVRHKREAFDNNESRGPYGSNYLSRYVELVLVADHRLYKSLGGNIYRVHTLMRDLTNIINSIYSPLNIYITLVGVDVWNLMDEIRLSNEAVETLDNFLEYRRTRLISKIKNDNAHLITLQKFDKGVVGNALEGVMCTYKSSGGIATYQLDSSIDFLAATITHEMGHNFGISHDDKDDNESFCKCRDKSCIMGATITKTLLPVHWSSCSRRSLTRAFDRGAEYCLRNKPKRLFLSPTCGNGFVERGEQCDCGRLVTNSKRNACHLCCHPHTCTFRRNASCASGECCDLTICQPKSEGTVCRPAHKECDLPEYCTGHSEFCPRDVFKMDSTPCGKHREAYCAGGSCKSHSTQCQMLWGPSASDSHAKCYLNNRKGNKYGNCGYDLESNKYEPCSSEDVFCGRLQCRRFENLRFGYESHAYLNAFFETSNGKLIQCHTASVDLGVSEVDPGLVPDGAKCGENKMCYKQRCRLVNAIRAEIAACPSDCNGRGVCNSKGHCHCNPGFAPPDCAVPGPGGSYDSGPATKKPDPHHKEVDFTTESIVPTPHPDGSNTTRSHDSGNNETGTDSSAQKKLMMAIYIIFLGVLPLILLILVVIYFKQLQEFCRSRFYRFKRHRTGNNTSFFENFPKITVITSVFCRFFTSRILNERADPPNDTELSDIYSTNTSTNVNTDYFPQCQTSVCDIANKKITPSKQFGKKISRKSSYRSFERKR